MQIWRHYANPVAGAQANIALYSGREEISMRGYKPWQQIGIKYEIFLNNKYPIDVFKNQNFCTMVFVGLFAHFNLFWQAAIGLYPWSILCSLNFGSILSNFLLFESLISKDHYDDQFSFKPGQNPRNWDLNFQLNSGTSNMLLKSHLIVHFPTSAPSLLPVPCVHTFYTHIH